MDGGSPGRRDTSARIATASGYFLTRESRPTMSIAGVPYGGATAGAPLKAEIEKLLCQFKCERICWTEETDTHTVRFSFVYRGYLVEIPASAQGWANYCLKLKPKINPDRALKQGKIAIYSELRDWIKGQLTAVETGRVTFERAFVPYMLLPDGRSAGEYMLDPQNGVLRLPAPQNKD